MNQDVEDDINYHNATLKEAINALENKELIAEINKLSFQKNCRINICHHKDIRKKDEIHFILEPTTVGDQIIVTDIDTSKISAFISDSINYDSVFVDFKGEYKLPTFERLFEDLTSFSLENYNNIHAYFQRHYPEYYLDQSENVAAHQDKRRRSVSPSSSSLFPRNNHQQDEVNLPTPEMVVEHLQKASWWPELKRTSPEKAASVIDQACGRAKRALGEGQTSDLRPTGAAK